MTDTGLALVKAINAAPDNQTARGAFADWSAEQDRHRPLKRYYVVTPEYSSGGGEYEPPEWGCDVVDVEARTKREAISIGVHLMLKHKRTRLVRYEWVHDQRGDRRSPYSGVKAHEYPDEEIPEAAT